MPAVAGYSHVAICVSNVEESKHFYGEQLGLGEIDRPDFGFPEPGTRSAPCSST